MRNFMFVAGLLAMLLSACAAPPPATVDPAQVHASAVAALDTMVAMTQAAVPTGTPTPPPTEALPTPTSIPTIMAPTAAPTSAQDSCVHPLDMGQAGPTHRTLIRNETTATINISLNLYQPNALGECGALSYANLDKNSTLMVELPAGNWYAYAWATVKGNSFTTSGSFYVQPAQFDKVELCVRTDNIVYKPQC